MLGPALDVPNGYHTGLQYGACQNDGIAEARAAALVFVRSTFEDGFVIYILTPTSQSGTESGYSRAGKSPSLPEAEYTRWSSTTGQAIQD